MAEEGREREKKREGVKEAIILCERVSQWTFAKQTKYVSNAKPFLLPLKSVNWLRPPSLYIAPLSSALVVHLGVTNTHSACQRQMPALSTEAEAEAEEEEKEEEEETPLA